MGGHVAGEEDDLGPLAGIRVVEVASWLFVPSAAVVLAQWGAEVVKVEHPLSGDPVRGLSDGNVDVANDHLNYGLVQGNQCKRSIGLDLTTGDGREVLLSLVAGADVFLTNYLPAVRARLGIDVADVRARNPRIVYAVGSGCGPAGPERDRAGMDTATLWARSGMGEVYREAVNAAYPFRGVPGFGDL